MFAGPIFIFNEVQDVTGEERWLVSWRVYSGCVNGGFELNVVCVNGFVNL